MSANAATLNSPTSAVGAPVAEYRGAPKRGILRSLGLLLLIGGEAGALFGLFSPYLFETDDRALIIAIGSGIALIGLLFLAIGVIYRQAIVSIFTDGLEYRRGNVTLTVKWNEIATIRQAVTKHYTNFVYSGTTHVYTMQLTDGRKIIFNDRIKNVEKLGELLQKKIADVRLPEVIQQYNMGSTIEFGPVALNSTGILRGRLTIPWPEVRGVNVVKGYVRVEKAGARGYPINVSVSTIPNLYVFLVMVDRIVGLKG
jgi:hypothetical protein